MSVRTKNKASRKDAGNLGLLEHCGTYYSLEIHAPQDPLTEISPEHTAEPKEYSDGGPGDISSNGDFEMSVIAEEPSEPLTLQHIGDYMRTQWKPSWQAQEGDKSKLSDDKSKLPLYTYCHWPACELDMCRLSGRFADYTFMLFGKEKVFLDHLWCKTYRAGRCTYHSADVQVQVTLKLGDGSERRLNTSGLPELSEDLDAKQWLLSPVNRSGAQMERTLGDIAVDNVVLFGQAMADAGGVLTDMAVAMRALAIGLTILDQMHQNLIRYNNNKGRAANLYQRCKHTLQILQNMPAEQLDAGCVVSVVNQIKHANEVLLEYSKQSRVVRFFGSNSNKRKLTDVNGDLSDSLQDLQLQMALLEAAAAKQAQGQ